MSNNQKGTDTFAVAGFTLGLVSMFLDFWGAVGLLATIFSAIGLKNINKTKGNGKGIAIAGLVLGIIGIAWGIWQLIVIFTTK